MSETKLSSCICKRSADAKYELDYKEPIKSSRDKVYVTVTEIWNSCILYPQMELSESTNRYNCEHLILYRNLAAS